MIIDLSRFIARERDSWLELERLLERLENDPTHRLDLEQTRHFHSLYQKASADLARLNHAEPQTRRYLETLVARAYGEIHETRERSVAFHPWRWFTDGFPKAFQRHVALFWLSLLVTVLGAAFGASALMLDPEAKPALLPAMFSNHNQDPGERVRREETAKDDRLRGEKTTFSAELMNNNIRVSIFTLGLGMTWGIGTLIVLFHNGVLLGLISMDYILAGQSVFLLGWLLPHGAIEIPAILIAGQGGLLLGRTLLGAGSALPLQARLRAIAPDLSLLIFGAAVLLVWAGIVEAFFSQYHEPILPYWVKISFGMVELGALIWFLKRHVKRAQD